MMESNSLVISEKKKAELNKRSKEATKDDNGHTEELSD